MLRKRVLRRTTLPKVIADHLTSEIRSGRLRPGERLPTEKVLMQQFGVGRSTIREALQHLVILGLAEAKRGFGYKIKSFDRHTLIGPDVTAALLAEDALLDLLEAREIVEVPIARLAATRATVNDLVAMERLLARMEDRLLRGQTVHRLAARFHLLIARAAKNATLGRWITSIIPLLTARGWQLEHDIPGRSARELSLHRELYERIKSRDPDAVQRAMVEHLADTRATILQYHDALSNPGGPDVRARSDR